MVLKPITYVRLKPAPQADKAKT
uniref:Uncharacterized protein n=1 Tax=Rhizophora mucronata TaxID=61149 RepID=A0A2P2P3G8_RHIMU